MVVCADDECYRLQFQPQPEENDLGQSTKVRYPALHG
jgi:hypothetical protein